MLTLTNLKWWLISEKKGCESSCKRKEKLNMYQSYKINFDGNQIGYLTTIEKSYIEKN